MADRVRLRRFILLLAGAGSLTGCAYFNTMYNAQRRFGAAERAAARGERDVAARNYMEAIDKAAASYRGHPASRWADDALFLIGRARFALAEYDAARAAFRTLLDSEPGESLRAAAQAWLGASEVQRGDAAAAEQPLDAALAADGINSETGALAHLWRARARFQLGRSDDAWADLAVAQQAQGGTGLEAHLETAARAVALGDTARLARSLAKLFQSAASAQWADSLNHLVIAAAANHGPAYARLLLNDVADGPWPATQREPQLLTRVRLSADAGDTAAAIGEAIRLAQRATSGTAGQARRLAAHLELARVDSLQELARIRALLLPSLDDPDARSMVRAIRVIEVLLARAAAPDQALALFAAGEFARDDLHSARLARRLFRDYADSQPDAVWAPKALLAAAALADSPAEHDALVARFQSHAANVYVQAVTGSAPAEAYTRAEAGLDHGMSALRAEALALADAQDVGVGTVLARLDSMRARVSADSLTFACGIFVDSLTLSGIRADSVRAACMRRDTANVTRYLRLDTLLLRDTAAARRNRRGTRLDTSDSGRG